MQPENPDYDVIVIGAGPAGISSAIWCSQLGLRTIVFEREPAAGGQMLHIYGPVNNYPGLYAANGMELCERFLRSADTCREAFHLSAEVEKINPEELSVLSAGGGRVTAGAIIFATGVRRRKLGVPGEDTLAGKGILVSGAQEKDLARERAIAIVGGGDAALENALILSEMARKVYVIHRSRKIKARSEFVERSRTRPNVEFILDANVTAINGTDHVASVTVLEYASGTTRQLPVDLVLVRIGVQPNSELLRGIADLDNGGYVVVDSLGQTSAALVYAIGDVASPVSPTIATATGMGSTAAKHVRFRL